jgi:hypothetical protein
MAKKKIALQNPVALPKADYYLYKPEPLNPGSLRTVPKERAFGKKRQKVAFYNGNDGPIRVSFLGPLQASPNPLTIRPGHVGKVMIDPVAHGTFPCLVEILLATCPLCESRLKGQHLLYLRPESLAAIDSEAACYCTDGFDDDEADPIIIIKPQGLSQG